jgi:hypothetical protein
MADYTIAAADPRWKRFEEPGARMIATLNSGAQVVYDDNIRGRFSDTDRQIDVSIRSQAGSECLAIVQCRDYKGAKRRSSGRAPTIHRPPEQGARAVSRRLGRRCVWLLRIQALTGYENADPRPRWSIVLLRREHRLERLGETRGRPGSARDCQA